jgi:hypothetical protein
MRWAKVADVHLPTADREPELMLERLVRRAAGLAFSAARLPAGTSFISSAVATVA